MQNRIRSPLGISPNSYRSRSALPGPYFVDWATRSFRSQQGKGSPLPDNTPLFTSMDPLLATKLDRIVPRMLSRMERWYPSLSTSNRTDPLEAAVVVMDPQTGEVQALLGYNRSPFNRAILSKRLPASLFKLVPYLVALTPESNGPPGKYDFSGDRPFLAQSVLTRLILERISEKISKYLNVWGIV